MKWKHIESYWEYASILTCNKCLIFYPSKQGIGYQICKLEIIYIFNAVEKGGENKVIEAI